MTQTIFNIVATFCCIYTAYRLGLFIYKKIRKSNRIEKPVQNIPLESSGKIEPATAHTRNTSSAVEEYADIPSREHPPMLSYRGKYLINYPVGNRIQVYINRDSYAYIKRFLSIVAPDTSMSSFISGIIDEHLKKHEKEMSELYAECISKPL